MSTIRLRSGAIALVLMSACAVAVEDSPPDEAVATEQALAGGSTIFSNTVWGQVDDAIGRVDGGSCTGALIGETTVLAAAHCFCPSDELGPNSNHSRCNMRANFTLDNGDTLAGDVVLHPQFGQSWWHAYDYALIKLDARYTTIPPIPFSDTRPVVGDTIRLVGYGKQGTPCTIAADSQKRTTTAVVDAAQEDWDFSFTNTTRHLCPGDSGGPVLQGANGALQIVGVNSWKDNADDSHAVFKPTQVVYDWLIENLPADDIPGNTWGYCVYYRNYADGQYVSSRNDASFVNDTAWMNNALTEVWVRKGYKATLYDSTSYTGELVTLDGYQGSNCNQYGCFHTLAGQASNDRAGSARCVSAAPADTWGDCVYYPRYGNGAYVSVRGNVELTGSYAGYDNRTTNVWVENGAHAELYSQTGYQGYKTTLSGTQGTWCNSFGCLHDLDARLDDTGARLASNTMSSAKCFR
jgi:V8-like Glu-specific endopeptidase